MAQKPNPKGKFKSIPDFGETIDNTREMNCLGLSKTSKRQQATHAGCVHIRASICCSNGTLLCCCRRDIIVGKRNENFSSERFHAAPWMVAISSLVRMNERVVVTRLSRRHAIQRVVQVIERKIYLTNTTSYSDILSNVCYFARGDPIQYYSEYARSWPHIFKKF